MGSGPVHIEVPILADVSVHCRPEGIETLYFQEGPDSACHPRCFAEEPEMAAYEALEITTGGSLENRARHQGCRTGGDELRVTVTEWIRGVEPALQGWRR